MRSDRLLELAAHLKSDRRGHTRFDIRVFCAGPDIPANGECGTSGCSLGECPYAFPNDWFFWNAFDNDGIDSGPNWAEGRAPLLRTKALRDPLDCAMEWFALDTQEVLGLFGIDEEMVIHGEVIFPQLPLESTAQQAADRFIAFVKWREEQAEYLETGKGESDAIT